MRSSFLWKIICSQMPQKVWVLFHLSLPYKWSLGHRLYMSCSLFGKQFWNSRCRKQRGFQRPEPASLWVRDWGKDCGKKSWPPGPSRSDCSSKPRLYPCRKEGAELCCHQRSTTSPLGWDSHKPYLDKDKGWISKGRIWQVTNKSICILFFIGE